MGQEQYVVQISWDPEANVWVATSDDVPGLVTEAANFEALLSKLNVMIPELLEANGSREADHVPFRVCADLVAAGYHHA